jgi:hypothetical protein
MSKCAPEISIREFFRGETLKTKSRLRSILMNTVISLISIAAALGISYYALRRTGLYKKFFLDTQPIIQEAENIAYVQDIFVGRKLKPLTQIHYQTPYFDMRVVTNSEGFTGRDYFLNTDNYRIAILGDSIVESYGVDDTNRFNYLIESYVYAKTAGKTNVEAMGFGISGWGQAHAYGCIKHYVLKYKPNEVWLMFMPINDVGDNTPYLNGPPTGPTFIYKEGSDTVIEDIRFGFVKIPDAAHAERFKRFGNAQVLADIWQRWTYGLYPYYYSSEKDPLWETIWGQTLQTFALIKKICAEQNIRVRVIYRQSGYEQDAGDWDRFKKDVTKFLGKEIDLQQHLGEERTKQQLAELGIEFISLLDMPENKSIRTKSDEAELGKHAELADFLSDVLLKTMPPGWGEKINTGSKLSKVSAP